MIKDETAVTEMFKVRPTDSSPCGFSNFLGQEKDREGSMSPELFSTPPENPIDECEVKVIRIVISYFFPLVFFYILVLMTMMLLHMQENGIFVGGNGREGIFYWKH